MVSCPPWLPPLLCYRRGLSMSVRPQQQCIKKGPSLCGCDFFTHTHTHWHTRMHMCMQSMCVCACMRCVSLCVCFVNKRQSAAHCSCRQWARAAKTFLFCFPKLTGNFTFLLHVWHMNISAYCHIYPVKFMSSIKNYENLSIYIYRTIASVPSLLRRKRYMMTDMFIYMLYICTYTYVYILNYFSIPTES